MEQAYILERLKIISVPELMDALAEAHADRPLDIYEHLDPLLIDRTTDAIWDFIDAVNKVKATL